MAKKKKANKDKNLLRFQRSFSGSNVDVHVAKFKQNVSLENIRKYYSSLFRTTEMSSVICPDPFPKELGSLKNNAFLSTSSLLKELAWNALLINEFRNEINEFLTLKKEFESYLLDSELKKGYEVLDVIKSKFGQSLWLIQNELILKQKIEGLDAQKEFAKKLKDEAGPGTITSFLIHFLSIRCEDNISYDNFQFIIDDQLYSMDLNMELSAYLRYRLSLQDMYKIKFDDLAGILAHESTSSIIDIYETFVQIAILLTANLDIDTEKALDKLSLLGKQLFIVKNDFKDNRLISLDRIFGKCQKLHTLEGTSEVLNILDFYTSGKYEECIKACQSLLEKHHFEVAIFEVYIQSHIFLSKKPIFLKENLLNEILKSIYNILMKNEETFISTIDLLKVMTTYNGASWINELYSFIVRQLSEEKLFQRGFPYKLGLISSQIPSPFKYTIYTNKCKSKYFEELEQTFGDSSTLSLFNKVYMGSKEKYTSEIPRYRIQKYEAINSYLQGDFKTSLSFFTKLLDEKNILILNDARSGYLNALIENGDIESACNKLVDYYLINPDLYVNLPIKKLISRLDSPENWPKTVNIPILYHLYLKYYDSDKEIYLKFAYENFLNVINKERPMQIFKDFESYKYEKILYFLRYICVPEFMKQSISFSSSLELEEERISICNKLKEIDTDNSKLYEEEVRNRTKKIVIQEGVSRVEKSRIYVDINKVKNSVEKLLKENYKRYQSFKEDNKGVEVLDNTLLKNTLEKVQSLGEYTDEMLYSLHVFEIPSNERDDLFHKMLMTVRDAFINGQYGLNGYLSTRIRHGNLSNQLRGPVEREYLVTVKSNETDEYIDNDHWSKELKTILSDSERSSVLFELKNFSREYDELITFIKDKVIQVDISDLKDKMPPKTDAMFKYYITNLEQKNLENEIKQDTSYDQFIDLLVKWMWEKTDFNLKNVRYVFTHEYKENFVSLFDQLESKLKKMGLTKQPKKLSDSIARARTEVQAVIDNISTWFTRSEFSEHNNYEVEIAIKIAEKILARKDTSIVSGIELNLKIDDKILMVGRTLESFVDIFYILFDNAIKHCGLTAEYPKIHLEISVANDKLNILFSNPVITNKSVDELNANLETIKSAYGKEDAQALLTKEGGTGFYKIWKILDKDLSCEHLLKFKYKHDTEYFDSEVIFEVILTIESKELFGEIITN